MARTGKSGMSMMGIPSTMILLGAVAIALMLSMVNFGQENSHSGRMALRLLHSAVKEGAVCLDGSPPGYYFRRGFGEGKESWHVFFEGGAWCSDVEDCWNRSHTVLGSSKGFYRSNSFGGIFSSIEEKNPDFYNWNSIYIKYCDGASFSGHLENPVIVKGKKLYFRGYRILNAIVNDLMTNKGMKTAKKVLIGGCSAGGLSSYLHCDAIKDKMPSTASIKCYSDAGLFADIADVEGNFSMRTYMEKTFMLHNSSGGVNLECLSARPDSLKYQCFFAQYTLPYIQTPFFIINSNYDSYMLESILASEKVDPRGIILRNCALHLSPCDSQQFNMLSGLREEINKVLDPLKKKSNFGAFLFSCMQHCTARNDSLWNGIYVGNHSLRSALGDWFFERSSGENFHIDCPFPCNKCMY